MLVKQDSKTITLTTTSVIALLMPILISLPYSYFMLLRWLVCALSVYYAYLFYSIRKKGLFWIMIIIAVFFNPITPLLFDKIAWLIIDFITALLFIFVCFYLNICKATKFDGVGAFTPKWLTHIQPHLRPINKDIINELQGLKEKYNIPDDNFAMRIISSSESVTKKIHNEYLEIRKKKPNFSNREVYQTIINSELLSRFTTEALFHDPKNMSDVEEMMIQEERRKIILNHINTLNELSKYFVDLNERLTPNPPDQWGLGKKIDILIKRDNDIFGSGSGSWEDALVNIGETEETKGRLSALCKRCQKGSVAKDGMCKKCLEEGDLRSRELSKKTDEIKKLTASIGKKVKVLCIDDEPSILESYKMILKVVDIDVVVAPDGNAGLNLLTPDIDMVITGYFMPGLTGFDVLDKIKESYPLMPVAIIASYSPEGIRQQALAKGAIEYLRKPFLVEEFYDLVLKGIKLRDR